MHVDSAGLFTGFRRGSCMIPFRSAVLKFLCSNPQDGKNRTTSCTAKHDHSLSRRSLRGHLQSDWEAIANQFEFLKPVNLDDLIPENQECDICQNSLALLRTTAQVLERALLFPAIAFWKGVPRGLNYS